MAIYRGIGSASSTSDQAIVDAVTDKANEAATSANSASSSASTAGTHATSAQSSAATALANANASSNSASEAATSATNAAASYDSFDDRYLGAKSSDPSTDNDGDALISGALYFNTTTNYMKVYDGSAWQDAYANVDEAIGNVVEDTTPQLGGTLDANGNTIDMGTNTITDTKVGQWDTAYGWGDHGTEGYLTSETFTELSQDTTPQLGGNLDSNSFNINMGDSDFINVGSDNDMVLKNGSYISSTWGEIHFPSLGYLTTNAGVNSGIYIKHGTGPIGSEQIADFLADGPVRLYNNGSQKFTTTTTGIDVTGEVQCDSLDVDGAIDLDTTSTGIAIDVQCVNTATATSGPDINLYRYNTAWYNSNTQSGKIKFASRHQYAAFTHSEIAAVKVSGNVPGYDGYLAFRNTDQSNTTMIERMRMSKDGIIINEASDAGTDFRVESDSNTHMLFVDSSANAIGINNSSPSDALDVTGTVSASRGIGATLTDTTNTGNVTLDFSTYQNFVLTLTGNVTLVNPTTEAVGQSGFIVLIQDSTGGRTLSLGTDYETAAGAGITLSSTASTTDIVPYIVAASGRILLGAPQLAFS